MLRNFDLFGNPISDEPPKRGRPEHKPDPEIESNIRDLIAIGMTKEQIAEEVGLSVPTLNKHYLGSGNLSEVREDAVKAARARAFIQLQKQADEGNVTALKEVLRRLDVEQTALDAERVRATKPTHSPPVGKKAQQNQDATEAADGDDGSAAFLPNYRGVIN